MKSSPDDRSANEAAAEGADRTGHARLWTPWRMRYVGGAKTESGCVLCNRLAAADDVESLILHRGAHSFVIMNLFPYNTGHTMIVPHQHTASPEVAASESVIEMAHIRRPVLRALRRALSCHGFNLGMNIGAEAGAGITDHLHEHVVPRWLGDANFMPILASTAVMPEMIPITYAKLRAELGRELTGDTTVATVMLNRDHSQVLVDADGFVPALNVTGDEPIWKWAAGKLDALCGADPQLAGWAGPNSAGGGPLGLTFECGHTTSEPGPTASGLLWVTVEEATAGPDTDLITTSLRNLPG